MATNAQTNVFSNDVMPESAGLLKDLDHCQNTIQGVMSDMAVQDEVQTFQDQVQEESQDTGFLKSLFNFGQESSGGRTTNQLKQVKPEEYHNWVTKYAVIIMFFLGILLIGVIAGYLIVSQDRTGSSKIAKFAWWGSLFGGGAIAVLFLIAGITALVPKKGAKITASPGSSD